MDKTNKDIFKTGKFKNIPIQEPVYGSTIVFDSKNCVIAEYDWEGFLKMDREKQIEELEFLLGGLIELPKNIEIAKRRSLDAGLKSGK